MLTSSFCPLINATRGDLLPRGFYILLIVILLCHEKHISKCSDDGFVAAKCAEHQRALQSL